METPQPFYGASTGSFLTLASLPVPKVLTSPSLTGKEMIESAWIGRWHILGCTEALFAYSNPLAFFLSARC